MFGVSIGVLVVRMFSKEILFSHVESRRRHLIPGAGLTGGYVLSNLGIGS